MYKLIRRISSSVFTRNDRPFNEDATSNAPSSSRKRRMSQTELQLDTTSSSSPSAKKSKHHGDEPHEHSPPPVQQNETEDLKQVRKAVKGVDLEEKKLEISLDAIVNTPLPVEDPTEEDTLLEDTPGSESAVTPVVEEPITAGETIVEPPTTKVVNATPSSFEHKDEAPVSTLSSEETKEESKAVVESEGNEQDKPASRADSPAPAAVTASLPVDVTSSTDETSTTTTTTEEAITKGPAP